MNEIVISDWSKRPQINKRKVNPLFLIIVFIFIINSVSAQDRIYLKSDTLIIHAIILEVNPTTLKYKKTSNLSGPIYTIEKKSINKVVYQNGAVETYKSEESILKLKSIERQTSLDLIPGSRLFLTFVPTDKKKSVNGHDAKEMLKSYLLGKTSCVVVNSIDEADFIIELSVIKKAMADRSAKITIRHILSIVKK